jgi:hypothetical protein
MSHERDTLFILEIRHPLPFHLVTISEPGQDLKVTWLSTILTGEKFLG